MSDIFDRIASDFKREKTASFLTQPLRMRYDYGERHATSFTDMDEDNDGRISPAEWEEGFDMIDSDNSGYISEEEWDNANFDDLDEDDDGVISRAEWNRGFDDLDEDDDGFLSEGEFYSRKADDVEEIIDDISEVVDDLEDAVVELGDDENFSTRFVSDFGDEVKMSKKAGGYHHEGSYMSRQNIREMVSFLSTLLDQVHEGEELDDWVEDKISHAHATLSDLHRYFGYGRGHHHHTPNGIVRLR